MPYMPSDAYVQEFTTADPTTRAAADADSTPTATADFYGSGTGTMALTVTRLDTGRYKVAGTIPSGRARGDVLVVSVAATCGGIAGKAVIGSHVIETAGAGGASAGDIATAVAAQITTDHGSGSYVRNTEPDNASVAAIKAKTDNLPASPAAVGSAMVLASAGLDAVIVETGVNARQALAAIAAVAAGKATGLDTGSPVFKGVNTTTTRVSATTDADGNRSAVTLSLPA